MHLPSDDDDDKESQLKKADDDEDVDADEDDGRETLNGLDKRKFKSNVDCWSFLAEAVDNVLKVEESVTCDLLVIVLFLADKETKLLAVVVVDELVVVDAVTRVLCELVNGMKELACVCKLDPTTSELGLVVIVVKFCAVSEEEAEEETKGEEVENTDEESEYSADNDVLYLRTRDSNSCCRLRADAKEDAHLLLLSPFVVVAATETLPGVSTSPTDKISNSSGSETGASFVEETHGENADAEVIGSAADDDSSVWLFILDRDQEV